MNPRITTNAGELAARIRVRGTKYLREIRRANEDNANLVMRKARQFTAQRFFSLAQLRAMGHPYAKRNPFPPVRPHILNRQNGLLHRSWLVRVRRYGDGSTASVVNTAPYAKYMTAEGTTKMIGRPVLDEALARTQPERARNMRNARRRGYYRVTGR